jgi:hypothetical protein
MISRQVSPLKLRNPTPVAAAEECKNGELLTLYGSLYNQPHSTMRALIEMRFQIRTTHGWNLY